MSVCILIMAGTNENINLHFTVWWNWWLPGRHTVVSLLHASLITTAATKTFVTFMTMCRLGFEYTMKNGVATEASYPYKGRDEACDKQKMNIVGNISGMPHSLSVETIMTVIFGVLTNLGPCAVTSGYCRLPHVSDNFTAAEQCMLHFIARHCTTCISCTC